MPVDQYLENCLRPQLRRCQIGARQQRVVLNDVRKRLHSILGQWQDDNSHKTLLLIGREEAEFYRPANAPVETRSLVVVGIRNSLIEDLSTSEPYTPELQLAGNSIPDNRMPEITGEAIRFFARTDFDACAGSFTAYSGSRPFGDLSTRYPRAWRALQCLSHLTEGDSKYDPVDAPIPDLPHTEGGSAKEGFATDMQSGIDPRFSPILCAQLEQVSNDFTDCFFVDSFKSISRCPEKLFAVLEFVLAHGARVVTLNFLIEPGYVARRSELVRPIHNFEDLRGRLQALDGLTSAHREVLEAIAEMYQT